MCCVGKALVLGFIPERKDGFASSRHIFYARVTGRGFVCQAKQTWVDASGHLSVDSGMDRSCIIPCSAFYLPTLSVEDPPWQLGSLDCDPS